MINSDSNTTIKTLKSEMEDFLIERDWIKDHNPKDVAIALHVESGELLEHFLWKKKEEIENLLKDSKIKKEISYELADILSYCFSFANRCNIDLATAFREKMVLNKKKYPVFKVD